MHCHYYNITYCNDIIAYCNDFNISNCMAYISTYCIDKVIYIIKVVVLTHHILVIVLSYISMHISYCNDCIATNCNLCIVLCYNNLLSCIVIIATLYNVMIVSLHFVMRVSSHIVCVCFISV